MNRSSFPNSITRKLLPKFKCASYSFVPNVSYQWKNTKFKYYLVKALGGGAIGGRQKLSEMRLRNDADKERIFYITQFKVIPTL